jgi:hypothetical protein
MHKRISLFAGLTALFAMASAHADYTCPFVVPTKLTVPDNINPETGHTFDVYKADGICWVNAQAFVALLDPQGSPTTKPHLATITSSSENQWIVDQLLTPALNLPIPLAQSQVWIGGFRDGDATATGGWRWENDEGPFSGVNGGTGFTNWATSEPNNTGGSENWVTLGRYSTNLSGWNDEGAAVGSIGGFIVEYDTPRTAANCVGTTTEACTTVRGQTLTFPAGSFDQNTGNIKFTAYEFNDPRVDPSNGKCSVSRGPLVLFNDAAFGPFATLTIPEYLCGSPKFLVVKVDASDLTIKKGAVLVVNETDVILPGNLYKCFDPILGRVPALADLFKDPQNQDVVVWQSTDPSKMLEGPVGSGVGVGPSNGIYFGTAAEITSFCGSTGAKARTGSYFLVGMHVDFNLANDYPANSAANYANFFALTQYKLSLLKQSVENARLAGSINKPDAQAMASMVKNAITAMNAGDPGSALNSVNKFLFKVNSSTYFFPVTVTENYNGDHLMRGENIAFTLRVKVIPYKPVP